MAGVSGQDRSEVVRNSGHVDPDKGCKKYKEKKEANPLYGAVLRCGKSPYEIVCDDKHYDKRGLLDAKSIVFVSEKVDESEGLRVSLRVSLRISDVGRNPIENLKRKIGEYHP